jgi:hypothetical protein
MADVRLVRSSEIGKTEDTTHCRSHLGHLLSVGDVCMGFDVRNCNMNDNNLESVPEASRPDVVIVKKIYRDKSLRNRKRKWRLKLMDGLHAGQVETKDNGTYSHRICPTNIKDEELTKKGRDDDPWPDAFPALVRQLPLVEKKKKMRADQGLRGVEKRKKKRNNQIEPPFPADCKLCVVMSTLHSNDDDEQKAGSRGRRKPEAVERDGTKKKKKGTHFSRERPYSL